MKKKKLITLFITLGCIPFVFVALSSFSKPSTESIPAKNASPSTISAARELNKVFVQAVKDAKPAVVNVKVESLQTESDNMLGQRRNPFEQFQDDIFEHFFGPSHKQYQRPTPQPQLSQGSGFIISPDGYVMTNYHVVKGANKVTVTLEDGYEKEYSADVVGGDPYTDVAVLKINAKSLPYITFGDSDKIQEGELVLAIGNPFQLKATVTLGIISAKGRQNLQINDLEDFIQTDAAINPGNSGGPLIDLDGKVIGMNTAIVSRSGGNMGIGFAIPSNMLANIRDQLIAKGEVTRGFLGVSLQPIDKDLADAFNLSKPEGALVSEVAKNSPADKAGLKQGDIITEVNGSPVKSPSNLRNEILLMQPGTVVNLTVIRDGKFRKIPVTLGTHQDTTVALSGMSQKIGIEVEELTPDKAKKYGYSQDEQGVLVKAIKRGSIAEKVGIPLGAVIIAVDHKKIANVEDFKKALEDVNGKERVLILVNYKGQMRFFSLKFSE